MKKSHTPHGGQHAVGIERERDGRAGGLGVSQGKEFCFQHDARRAAAHDYRLPPGGRRDPTVLSCRSASVTNASPIQAPTSASRTSGTGRASPEYHRDQRCRSSSSNLKRPMPNAPRPGGGADRRAGGRMGAAEAAPRRRQNRRRNMASMSILSIALSTPLARREHH